MMMRSCKRKLKTKNKWSEDGISKPVKAGWPIGRVISALLFVLVGSLPGSTASLMLPRNVLGEWCHEGDDDCQPDGVPGPMVVLPTSIKNWGDYEHDGIDCAVRVIPNRNGEASTTFANGFTSISFDLDCRGREKSFKGRALCRLQGDRLIIATRDQKGELDLDTTTREQEAMKNKALPCYSEPLQGGMPKTLTRQRFVLPIKGVLLGW
jgi:hypothetical protein